MLCIRIFTLKNTASIELNTVKKIIITNMVGLKLQYLIGQNVIKIKISN